ncbi:YbaB/EbfC family nucleoid-associated protein [Mycoplasmopsis alligatoris]|uniref:Nucleoid-associated protein MALL_0399 n=1 Tax=Mycoplasmopsis alligatoris A21JP2 TaxID=747682 RepID=D4XWM9_9BACT|nr:YbaB/EbfC family nucleoid-associated protein [Mycoplasmopsis alligatoris]EFF41286.1 DNA-binding protein, YbaB/EbfC family [Mycoplasmopsis alligatoris A21JP2]
MGMEMIKKMRKMQEELTKKQNEFAKKEFKFEKQGIKITMLGSKEIKSIKVDAALVDPEDVELLEDLLVVALNEAITTVSEEEDSVLSPQMPGGLPF